MEWITRAADKAGALGSIVSAASCPACFPALASLGAAMGLGFLAGYEGLFISTLLPLFAAVALIANALGWLRHRQWHRSVTGMIGPAMVLAAMLLFFGQWWTPGLMYTGLAFMVGASLWDLLSPANKRCSAEGCETRQVLP
ncbi:organomercurial transporter MerC [Variovorax paradoxus]|nr:organomercurial transporter MerC [Variovorax paradoxus]MBT2305138.1 organomercurial transporter MerC [Variovorax paradoxus]